jgi:hypothetical protein
MLLGVRLFIVLVFGIIGLSFLATTGVLIYEFWDAGWLALATFYSHLFIFFPTFGIVALLAFYTPACVFLDMYWRHVPYGRPRFIFGFLVVAGLAWLIAQQMQASPERSVWEIKPATLLADQGEPQSCAAGSAGCIRMPILQAIENVRAVSQRRVGLADLGRNCSPDPLINLPPGMRDQRRFCFASTPLGASSRLATDEECCQSQKAFIAAVNRLYQPPAQRSLFGQVHGWLLPLKVFFMLTLLTISIMLALRRHATHRYYGQYMAAIERGVLIGAAAMVMYPIMSHAFVQSASLLFGVTSDAALGYRSIAPYVSFGFGAWGLLLLFFFYSRRDKEMLALARMGGIVGSAVAIVKYDQIIDLSVRFFGSGASFVNLGLLACVALVAVGVLFFYGSRQRRAGKDGSEPAVAAADSSAG